MNSQNLHTMISRAKMVIGEAEDNDYIIQPTKHAAKFEKNAPSLAAVLRSSQIKVVAQQYEEADNIAIKAQENFKQTANRANWGVFLTAVFGVGIITVNALFPTNGGVGKPIFFIVLGLAGVLTGGLSAKWLFMIRRGNLLEEWMRSRAEAETYRIRYFKLATNFQPDNINESDFPVPLLQLEFFRRYQLADAKCAMRKASEVVLGGFPLRTEAKIFRYPERYVDDRGREMWSRVVRILDELGVGCDGTGGLSRNGIIK